MCTVHILAPYIWLIMQERMLERILMFYIGLTFFYFRHGYERVGGSDGGHRNGLVGWRPAPEAGVEADTNVVAERNGEHG